MEIQEGEHSSVDDAVAAMQLFKKHKTEWDAFAKRVEFRKDRVRQEAVGVEMRRLESREQFLSSRVRE
jgi:hypothetical protein